MKSTLRMLVLGISLLACAGTAAAQDTSDWGRNRDDYSHTITVNPFQLLFGVLNAEYEHAFTSNMSFYIGPTIWAWNGLYSRSGENVRGFGGNVGVRFFLIGRAPEGLWLAPDFGLYAVHAFNSSASTTGLGYSISGLVGYTFLFGAFDLSLGIGLEYLSDLLNSDSGVAFGGRELRVTGRTSIGFAF